MFDTDTDLQLSKKKKKQFHLDKSIRRERGGGGVLTVTQCTLWTRGNAKKILMQLAKSLRGNKVEDQDIQKL